MLHQYTRYLIKSLTHPLVFITLSMTGILWLTQSLRFIDLIINNGLSVGMFVYLTVLLMPSLLGIVLPIALYSTVIYVYNKLLMESELMILENAGLSKFALARPAIIVAILVALIGYSISLYLLPASYREFKDLQSFVRNNYASLLLQEEVFNTPMKGLTVYIRKREDTGILRGIFVHDNRNPEQPVTMIAQQGKLVRTSAGPQFVLRDGNRQEVDNNEGRLSLLSFESYTLDLSLYTNTTPTRWREPQERYLHELFWPDDMDDKDTIRLHDKLLAEAHQRLTWPLYSIALTLLGASTLLSGQFNRRGQRKRILVATMMGAGIIAAAIGTHHIVSGNITLYPLMYITPGSVILLCLYFLLRNWTYKIPATHESIA